MTARAGRTGHIVAVLGLLVIVGTTASLGQWQMRRAAYKQTVFEQHQAALRDEPIALHERAGALNKPDGLPMLARGRWLESGTIFIDNRTHNGIAGFHVLTPLALHEDATAISGAPRAVPGHVLVLRGWIAANPRNRNALPPVRSPGGLQTIRGIAEQRLAQAMQLGADVEPGPSDRLWQYFDLDKYRRWSGKTIHPFVIRQTSDAPDGLIRDWPQADSDVDKHHGYAFQWFAMSAAASAFLLWLVLSRVRRAFRRSHLSR